MTTSTILPMGSPGKALPYGEVPVASARHLDFHHANGRALKQVLFDVELDIWPGEMVMLTGPSGSGKSTLLSLVGGLRSVRQGELTVLGQQLSQATPANLVALRRMIGFIFQTHNLLEFLTVRRNVEMPLATHPEVTGAKARTRAEELLHVVGLGRQLHERPAALSVGQRQRVAIARALVSRPRLVLADEPTVALDSESGREIVQLLLGLAREQQAAILMVTHDQRVLDLADRVLAMEDGRLRTA